MRNAGDDGNERGALPVVPAPIFFALAFRFSSHFLTFRALLFFTKEPLQRREKLEYVIPLVRVILHFKIKPKHRQVHFLGHSTVHFGGYRIWLQRKAKIFLRKMPAQYHRSLKLSGN